MQFICDFLECGTTVSILEDVYKRQEECGGILTLEFTEDGTLEFKHTTSEYDGYYDEIGADLKIKQMRREGQEFLQALETYYRVFFLGESPESEEV